MKLIVIFMTAKEVCNLTVCCAGVGKDKSYGTRSSQFSVKEKEELGPTSVGSPLSRMWRRNSK